MLEILVPKDYEKYKMVYMVVRTGKEVDKAMVVMTKKVLERWLEKAANEPLNYEVRFERTFRTKEVTILKKENGKYNVILRELIYFTENLKTQYTTKNELIGTFDTFIEAYSKALRSGYKVAEIK